ncbi:hypothetical protein [Archaeoglobus profundus]|uniref:Uncharacterized protein n=1 Tax=Archaeoglobus profundus (strain DSM 5631 / JCM 9629 / NBRC 100127 / Av18) TaxID=572546 RepID=D2RF56_ARCPA|nr:hypothetical protein [Archaeoglobus profundus]ADB58750.1 hypothetical protein Arcpr_1704 [Archaeoglobus profundus DSM 5631]
MLRKIIGIIDKRIKDIEEDEWWHIDKNYDAPSDAVLRELKWLKERIIEELEEGDSDDSFE